MPEPMTKPLLTATEYLAGGKVAAVRNGVDVYRRETGWDLDVHGEGLRRHLTAVGGDLSIDEIYQDILQA